MSSNEHQHCWHERSRNSTTYGSHDGCMIKTERCCFCGDYQTLHFKASPPDGHGIFAPSVWRMIDSQRKAPLNGR